MFRSCRSSYLLYGPYISVELYSQRKLSILDPSLIHPSSIFQLHPCPTQDSVTLETNKMLKWASKVEVEWRQTNAFGSTGWSPG